jgi:DNA-directed RNA polymerase subunit K/omega
MKGRTEIPKDQRKYNNILSNYEYTRIILERIKMLNDVSYGQNPILFIDVNLLDDNKKNDLEYIANTEFKNKKLPFNVIRLHGDKYYEVWNLINDNMYVI